MSDAEAAITFNAATTFNAARTFNAAADHFDDDPLAFWARIGRRTIDRLDLQAGATVLDVGCGTGASVIPAAERVGPQGRVVGADLAEGLVAVGRRKARALGLSNIEFRISDMERLGYPDGRFDAVVSVFSIFFVPDMAGAIRELWRMVRPGGCLAITTWGPRFLEPGTSALWDAVKEVRPDLVPSASPWERLTETHGLRGVLQDAGIAEVEIVAENGRQPLVSPDDWWTIVLGSGFRRTVEQLGRDAAERVRSANLDRMRRGDVRAVETNVLYATARKAR